MKTAIHVVVITVLAGLIILILSRIGHRRAPGEDDTTDTGRRSPIPMTVVALIMVVLTAGSFLVYHFMSYSTLSPAVSNVQPPEKTLLPPPDIRVNPPAPVGTTETKAVPPSPPLKATESQTINAIYQRIGPSVVFILTSKSNNQQGYGSGFFINQRGDIITNHHVLRDATSAKIRTVGGHEYEIKSILAEDVANDLVMASVRINPGDVRPLTVSAAPPSIGEKVIVVGSPAGLEQTVTDGIVSALGRTFMGAGRFTQISAPISPGSSGSPVVNMRGEVIGVASGAYVANHSQNINFCSAGENIAALTPGNGYPIGRMDKPAWAVAAERRKAEEEAITQQQQQRQKMIADIQSMSDQAYTKATAGDNQTAFQLYEKCVSLCRQLENNRCTGTYLRNMGIILERMGKHDEAQLYFLKASEALAKK